MSPPRPCSARALLLLLLPIFLATGARALKLRWLEDAHIGQTTWLHSGPPDLAKMGLTSWKQYDKEFRKFMEQVPKDFTPEHHGAMAARAQGHKKGLEGPAQYLDMHLAWDSLQVMKNRRPDWRMIGKDGDRSTAAFHQVIKENEKAEVEQRRK